MTLLPSWVARIAAPAIFCIAVHPCFASEPEGVFSKREWTLYRYYCPTDCSKSTKVFLKSHIGSKVIASPSEFNAEFLDACNGSVRIDVRSRPADVAIKEISDSFPPRRRRSIAMLHLPKDVIESGVVLCSAGGTDSPMARLVSIEEGRILILFEDASFLELR